MRDGDCGMGRRTLSQPIARAGGNSGKEIRASTGTASSAYEPCGATGWGLEAHPPWVTKSPGAFDYNFERQLRHERPTSAREPIAPGAQPFRLPTAEWDPRFLVANVLSNDPVRNGLRKGLNNRRGATAGNLSPTRPWTER